MKCSLCSLPQEEPQNSSSGYYTICAACYNCAKSLLVFVSKLQNDRSDSSNDSLTKPSKGLTNAMKWKHKESDEFWSYVGGLIAAFRDGIHTDIEVKPGHNGPSIRTHRFLLASRSVIFKNLLDSDRCKAAPGDSITLPELTHEELQSFLEFLYFGRLPADKAQKHVRSLLLAAHKYEIPFLQKYCEQKLLISLSSSNAVDILEVSEACSCERLKETAVNYIAQNMEAILFSSRYEAFALNNPHLCLQISKASFKEAKRQKIGL